MRIKVDRFCALATARDWQTWLFEYDRDLYAQFVERLKASQGCQDNRNIMIQFLDIIKDKGGVEQLLEFLKVNYPQFVDGLEPVPANEIEKLNAIFSSNVWTFPRRKMFRAAPELLPRLIMDFVSDKTKYRSRIINDRAYVEYLDKAEEHLFNQIPAKNWSLRENKGATKT